MVLVDKVHTILFLLCSFYNEHYSRLKRYTSWTLSSETRNLAASRSRVSCAHNTSRASAVTRWP